MPGTIAVLTMTRHHHDQLLGQVDGLSVGSVPPAIHSVVSMGDRDLTRGRLPLATDRWTTIVNPVPTDRRALPVARARNTAAEAAIEAGADILVFLDGFVIPGSRTLEFFADAVAGDLGAPVRDEVSGPIIFVGPVLQLPEPENLQIGYPMGQLHGMAVRTPGTPHLQSGEVRVESRWELFRGTAFAMSAAGFTATGGFHPGYTGPGLEDADLAETVRRAGGALVWVGGATAYLQPYSGATAAEEDKIALNHAKEWKDRWGQHPDHPWLRRLAGEGRLRVGPDGSYRPR